jgi:stearoyl-CoA desaturase (Delta-9 desaturase)
MRTVLVALLVGVTVSLIANMATTVYLHRALAHRALTVRPPAAHAFRFVVWVTTGIRPRQWVAVHRKHHAFTDVEGDPHSPVLHGWVKVQLMNVAMYRREARNERTVSRYARDLPPTRLDRLLYDHALVGLGLGVAALCAVFGWQIGLLAVFVHVNVYLAGSAAVNAIGHHFGRRPYENNAGNLQWLAFVTAGEGLHNNHHAKPTAAKLSHRWFEIDPGWWLIRTLTWLRLARLRVMSGAGRRSGAERSRPAAKGARAPAPAASS